MGGFDATNKMVFIVHFQTAREVRQCGGLLFSTIDKLAKEKRFNNNSSTTKENMNYLCLV